MITVQNVARGLVKDYRSLVNDYVSTLKDMQEQFKTQAIVATQLVVYRILNVVGHIGEDPIQLFALTNVA